MLHELYDDNRQMGLKMNIAKTKVIIIMIIIVITIIIVVVIIIIFISIIIFIIIIIIISVQWLGECLSMPSPIYPVLCCPLSDRVPPVFVQVVSPPLGLSPLSAFLVVWFPRGDTRGPFVVFEAVDALCSGPLTFLTLLIISNQIRCILTPHFSKI